LSACELISNPGHPEYESEVKGRDNFGDNIKRVFRDTLYSVQATNGPGSGRGGGEWCPVANSRKHGEFLGSSEGLLACEEDSVSWSHCSVKEAVQEYELAERLM